MSIDVERQSLIIILLLGFFFIFEIQEKPYVNDQLNNVADRSQFILIFSLFMKLFSFSIENEILETLFTFLIFIFNVLFFCDIIFKMLKYQYGDFFWFFKIIFVVISTGGIFVKSLRKFQKITPKKSKKSINQPIKFKCGNN